ncbi:hypothetical protein [Sulfitobacter sp. 20_GPM-1509m]|uniref:hypothetical protein n=1 Tax=Sulfitobacter sp. 20_GPM-1509m TaxID=1380367 RepID=UPI0012DF1228|nr:hypothetical protein [Sulfitobacter sp. 20_GPM-1509m]
MIALSNETLGALPAGIDVPRDDRCTLKAETVHIGVGDLHRAHQSWYPHGLMLQGLILSKGRLNDISWH